MILDDVWMWRVCKWSEHGSFLLAVICVHTIQAFPDVYGAGKNGEVVEHTRNTNKNQFGSWLGGAFDDLIPCLGRMV